MRKIQTDLRSRITDEQPDIARQVAAQRIWSFPAPLARTLRCSNAEGMGRGLRGIEWPNATRRATHSDMPAQKRREPAIFPQMFTDNRSVFSNCAARHIGAGEHDSLCRMMSALA